MKGWYSSPGNFEDDAARAAAKKLNGALNASKNTRKPKLTAWQIFKHLAKKNWARLRMLGRFGMGRMSLMPLVTEGELRAMQGDFSDMSGQSPYSCPYSPYSEDYPYDWRLHHRVQLEDSDTRTATYWWTRLTYGSVAVNRTQSEQVFVVRRKEDPEGVSA